jgi:uncharacterized membrane protein YdjX (TVP38/TMEM64 family)
MLKKLLFRKSVLYSFLVVIFFVVAFWLAIMARENSFVQHIATEYGWLSVVLISILGSFTLIIPVPALSFVPLFIEAGLNFWGIVSIITFGAILSDIIVFYVARFGKKIVDAKQWKIFRKLDFWKNMFPRLPLVVLFMYSAFAPIPNELIVVPIALMGYSFKKFIWPLVAGSIIFNLLSAFGVINIFAFF